MGRLLQRRHRAGRPGYGLARRRGGRATTAPRAIAAGLAVSRGLVLANWFRRPGWLSAAGWCWPTGSGGWDGRGLVLAEWLRRLAREAPGSRRRTEKIGGGNVKGHPVWVALNSVNVRRRPTLPRPPGRSTIGAVGLNFQVRNGDWVFPRRYGHRNSIEISTNHTQSHFWLGVDRISGTV